MNGQNTSIGTWNFINVKLKISDKITLFSEAQLRSLAFYDDFHYYEYKGGISWNAKQGLNLSLGMGDYDTYLEGGTFLNPKNNDEFRLWPMLSLNQKIGRFNIEQRYRYEMRFTSKGYRNRYRYRINLSYPFGKVKEDLFPFVVNVNNELFFTNNEPYFERNRASINFGVRLSPIAIVQLGYLHQFDYKINDETSRDFEVVGINLEFSTLEHKMSLNPEGS